jgi:double-stranded uracil-DNA glycosylase
VLAAAVRPGSLDSAIDAKSARVNDFSAFLERRTSIELIAFNGRIAAQLFATRALPHLSTRAISIPRVSLPSTSPANAGLTIEQKRRAWHNALRPYLKGAEPSSDACPMFGEPP